MYKLKFSDDLYCDLEAILDYIRYDLHSPMAAQNLYIEIKNAYKKIKENPFIYPTVSVEQLTSRSYRFKMIKSYMMFFEVKEIENEIIIARFIYGRRDWLSILERMN